MKVIFVSLFFILSSYASGADNTIQHYTFDDECSRIYKSITQLKLADAKEKLDIYEGHFGKSVHTTHLRGYIDFFTIFINEDQRIYQDLKERRTQLISQTDQFDDYSPEYRFVKAELLLQWALIDLKFGENLKAGKALYDGYKLLEENKRLYPDFIENFKSLSIIHTLAESLPTWVRTLLGVEGSIALGVKEINTIKSHALADKNYIFRAEVAAINSYILFYQANQQAKAIQDLNSFNLDHKSSPIIAFLKASMSLRSGDNDACIKYLRERPMGKEYASFLYLEFMMGRSLLYNMDAKADTYLKAYVNKFTGRHFIKEAYQKLAWHALVVQNDPVQYRQYMAQCRVKGYALLDEDTQALHEAQSSILPQKDLLKARILFDGGYYQRSLDVLAGANKLRFDKVYGKEYQYRKGRCEVEMGKLGDAINSFGGVVAQKDNSFYYAAALLQIGLIYEKQGKVTEAKRYFKKCLEADPTEYKASLHQKAKSGLARK